MDRTRMEVSPAGQANDIAYYIESLLAEEQHSWLRNILHHAIIASERQDVSELKNTLEVTVTQAEAAAMISAPIPTSQGSYSYLLDSGGHDEQKVPRGNQEMTATEHPHVVRDPRIGRGEPSIRGTGVRVRTLVQYWRLGTLPEDLVLKFPHLTLAQVFDALSFYQDHQEEINTFIAQNRPDPGLLHDSVDERP